MTATASVSGAPVPVQTLTEAGRRVVVAPATPRTRARLLLDQMREVLAAVTDSDLAAPAATRHRIEGAVLALEVLVDDQSHCLVDRLTNGRIRDVAG